MAMRIKFEASFHSTKKLITTWLPGNNTDTFLHFRDTLIVRGQRVIVIRVGVDRNWWQVPFHHPIWPNAKGTEAAKFKDSYWLSVDKKMSSSNMTGHTGCLYVKKRPAFGEPLHGRIFAKSSSTYRCSLMDLSAHVLEGAEVTFQTLADGTASVENLSPEYQRYAFDDAIVTELGRREFDQ